MPDDFRFAFKVTDEITVKKFPKLDRFGDRAGKRNENFLNADLFASAFLSSCEHIRTNVGLLMFEFSRFWPSDYEHGRDVVADLDAFLGKLPKGWPYAVEIRNAHWLREEYFACLARHGVTHVYNSWDAIRAKRPQSRGIERQRESSMGMSFHCANPICRSALNAGLPTGATLQQASGSWLAARAAR